MREAKASQLGRWGGCKGPAPAAAAGVRVCTGGVRVACRRRREEQSRQRKPVRPKAWRRAGGWHFPAAPRGRRWGPAQATRALSRCQGIVFKPRCYWFWQRVASVLGTRVPDVRPPSRESEEWVDAGSELRGEPRGTQGRASPRSGFGVRSPTFGTHPAGAHGSVGRSVPLPAGQQGDAGCCLPRCVVGRVWPTGSCLVR